MAEKLENTRFWRAPVLGGVELLRAQYVQQRFTPHVHDSFVFTVIESGAQRFHHRGGEHIAPSGTMVIINPDELHTGATVHQEGWRYRGFYPKLDHLAEILREVEIPLKGTPRFNASVLIDPQVALAFQRLHLLAELDASALQLQALWREVTLLLFQRHAGIPIAPLPGKEPVAVRRAQELLLACLASPPSLQDLGRAVNLSPFHLVRVFRATTGLSPFSWAMQKRLAFALKLLREGISPAQVAADLGFSDQSHLTRQFKRAYGIGPGAYRDAIKN
ncbi:AraC family transcriptional regulator [Pseudomonas atacamensis]|uniref:AraC family transcriptional regulator n=1 Tax=Pseudomonas atacamensis TaxID=2565368 RepID=UPI001FADA464|nr:AraC family transcriptional regulator [Pseudomonas atacamensis]